MNEFKEEWYLQTLMLPEIQFGDSNPNEQGIDLTSYALGKTIETASLGTATMMMRELGRIQGNTKYIKALRVFGRVGTRAVPVLGVVLTVYDAYTIVKHLHDHA
jgi:hypothetical protein